MKSSFPKVKLFDFEINKTNCEPIDLSIYNEELKSINPNDLDGLHNFIFNKIQQAGRKAGIGGYLENRAIYKASEVFKADESNYRNIHLGIDIWVEAETKVYAPLNGEIHSFKNNNSFGDYGPTIITKHKFGEEEFYLLFGHLTTSSLEAKAQGMKIKEGELLCKVGHPHENVGWPPHLHFQMILNTQEFLGDYPGVCSENELAFYHKNCPDPNLLLQFN